MEARKTDIEMGECIKGDLEIMGEEWIEGIGD